MLARLARPDAMAVAFPSGSFHSYMQVVEDYRQISRARRKAEPGIAFDKATEERASIGRMARREGIDWLVNVLMRRAFTDDGFRERLSSFWADHFTAVGRNELMRFAQFPYIDEVIRPHISGRFADMLKSAAIHPMMLTYLDQVRSIGPNSKRSAKSSKGEGLNENLARELLELHTLGVGGPYTQKDVRQLAELLTGLHFKYRKGFHFANNRAEPGAETVLGVTYGGTKARLEDIHAVLDDLAMHPATARHLAWKLAVHFVSDNPDPDLVATMADRYIASGGHLMSLYEAMLSHPAAWAEPVGNVKQPVDFVGSALRALDLDPRHLSSGKSKKLHRGLFIFPMTLMGQPWGQQLGPDGWPESDEDWITPQRLAARVRWAMTAPFRLRKVLPDPREFVETALGRAAPESVRFAASAAENRVEGVGVVLASPAFQRM